MIVNCELCGQKVEVPEGLVDGQHVLCPYCGRKFSVSIPTGTELRSTDTYVFKIKSRVKDLFWGWVDAYKRIFDFQGRSNRARVCGFLVGEWLIEQTIWSSIWLWCLGNSLLGIIPQLVDVVSIYAGIALGVRRLHDMGRSGRWMWGLAILFVGGYMYDMIAHGRNPVISPFNYSVFRIDDYVTFLLVVICWIPGTKNLVERKASGGLKIPILCLVALFILFQISFYVMKTNGDSFREKIRQDIPFGQISYQMLSGEGGCSTYIVNTDGPANAQFMLIYAWGRLHACKLIRFDDASAAKKAQEYVEKKYKLEGNLRAIGQ